MTWSDGSRRRHAPLTPAVLAGSDPPADRARTMLHIDMDAFFASVEERDNPSLRGRPVVVGGGSGNRGVVTTANYVARRFGLKAGMPSGEARRLCPDAVFLPVNGRKYTYVSAEIMAALERFSPDVRPLSVDEASLDITATAGLFGGPEPLGRRLKDMVRTRFQLPCSVGIGPNRLVAKMAANLSKPDGLMVLTPETAAATFAPLPVDEMVGIGRATKRALEKLGIFTLGELAQTPERLLKARFGVLGPHLRRMARGEWAGRMRQDDERGPVEKSIGHQRTFGHNTTDLTELRARLVGLAEMVARRVRRGGFVGRVLTLKVRYHDFSTPHHQTRLPFPTDDEETLIDHAWRLLAEVLVPGKEVRLLGLSLGGLTKKTKLSGQMELFSSPAHLRGENLHRALDSLRDKWGERVIARAMGGRFKRLTHRRGTFEDIIPFRDPNRERVFERHHPPAVPLERGVRTPPPDVRISPSK